MTRRPGRPATAASRSLARDGAASLVASMQQQGAQAWPRAWLAPQITGPDRPSPAAPPAAAGRRPSGPGQWRRHAPPFRGRPWAGHVRLHPRQGLRRRPSDPLPHLSYCNRFAGCVRGRAARGRISSRGRETPPPHVQLSLRAATAQTPLSLQRRQCLSAWARRPQAHSPLKLNAAPTSPRPSAPGLPRCVRAPKRARPAAAGRGRGVRAGAGPERHAAGLRGRRWGRRGEMRARGSASEGARPCRVALALLHTACVQACAPLKASAWFGALSPRVQGFGLCYTPAHACTHTCTNNSQRLVRADRIDRRRTPNRLTPCASCWQPAPWPTRGPPTAAARSCWRRRRTQSRRCACCWTPAPAWSCRTLLAGAFVCLRVHVALVCVCM
jgi:hypothetical protein